MNGRYQTVLYIFLLKIEYSFVVEEIKVINK